MRAASDNCERAKARGAKLGRTKNVFEAAPRLGIDRSAYARILNALDMITASEISAAMPLPFPRGGV
ncbi:MAG: hypothetical protein M3178_14675 [Pseudomonadota bacterium]|nr:hypothetical protein [Pseudomonadota bacterium]